MSKVCQECGAPAAVKEEDVRFYCGMCMLKRTFAKGKDKYRERKEAIRKSKDVARHI